MAHLARAAGTDYSVAGGKTLIDGTAYNVVATREVENAKLVNGYVSTSTPGNYSSVTATIRNDAFQWDKFAVKMLTIRADTSHASDRVIGIAYANGGLQVSLVFVTGTGQTTASSVTLDTTTNGALKVTVKFSGSDTHNFPPFNWYAALEAKS